MVTGLVTFLEADRISADFLSVSDDLMTCNQAMCFFMEVNNRKDSIRTQLSDVL